MPRNPKVRWHSQAGCYCSDVGEPYVDKAGRNRRKTKYFQGHAKGDRAGAQRELDDYLRAREDRVVAAGEITLHDLVQLYLGWSERTAAPLTYRGHRLILSRFLAHAHRGRPIRNLVAKDLTATDLARVVNEWAKAGRAPNYIARMVASVQAVMNWAADPLPDREPERLIPANPVKGFSHEATRAARAPDRYAPDEEVAAFLAFLRKRADSLPPLTGRFEHNAADLIEVAALTGARPGELRVAEWGDFEPAAVELAGQTWGRITLDPKRWKAGRKTGQAREIFLPPEAVAIVERIRARPDHHPRFIWTHKRGARSAERGATVRAHGEPWTAHYLPRKIAALRRLAIAAKVPISDEGDNRFVLYRLRHTAAARLLMADVPVATVAKLLGTSPDMIVRTYQSFLARHLVQAASQGLGRKPLGDGGESASPAVSS